MKIIECKVNHVANPVGYEIKSPVFSWKVMEAKGKRQLSAKVRVSLAEDMTDCIVDTGFRTDIDSLGFKAEMELLPRTRYYWDVTVRTDAAEETPSAVRFFETGKMNEPWAAKWISCEQQPMTAEGNTQGAFERHPVFLKRIQVHGKPRNARLYVCGLGLYEAYCNGKKIGVECLTPYCNNYNRWLQYQTYDITEQLAESGGTAELAILLGKGWYCGRFGFNDPLGQGYYDHHWRLIAELHMAGEDGSETVVGTDKTWEVRRSNICFSNIYDGEQVDDTLEAPAAEPVIVCSKKARGKGCPGRDEMPKGALCGRFSLPVTVHEAFRPIALLRTPAGEQVLDMGQNFAGVFRLHVNEPKGAKIRLQFGEILQSGNFYRENLRSAKAEYVYVSDGTEKDIIPHFTFYGYRYAKVEGIRDLHIEDFTGLALYSGIEETGRLSTGSDLVNRLISNVRWGLKSNFVDVPTDCPQRDERMGWTGDAQVFSATACYLADSFAFYAKYLHDTATEQLDAGGKVCDVIPSVGNTGTSSVWGDASCIIPWNLYRFYGDIGILENQYESMKSWVNYVRKLDDKDHAWGRMFHYGDWLALDHPSGKADEVMGGTDVDFIANVYYMGSAEIVSEAAALLGRDADARRYRLLAGKLRRFIGDEYYSKNGRCCMDTQTALLLTLKYHLSGDEKRIREALKKRFERSGGKLQTGFVGTPILCGILSDNGMVDLAYELLLNEEYPGWLHEVKLGATTIWERWNSVLDDGSISSTGMNSLNHYSYGSIAEWLFAHGAGIRQREGDSGFRHAYLAPELNGKLRSLRAEYDSPSGTYKTEWKILDENHVELRVTVPFGCEAALLLPHASASVFANRSNPLFSRVENGACLLAAGEYAVVYETDAPLCIS